MLQRNIGQGKSLKNAAERNLQIFHAAFHDIQEKFDSFFDALICSAPDKLKELYDEMNNLIKKVPIAQSFLFQDPRVPMIQLFSHQVVTSHKLKQEQLDELKKVLHDEKWTDTGLSTGNDKIEDACKGLDEYIKKANETTTDEDEEIKEHIKEVEEAKEKMDSHPCPCVWSPWSDWSECSKTCESGSRHRDRQVEKEAINNGTECQGEDLEEEVCNDVCCRKYLIQ